MKPKNRLQYCRNFATLGVFLVTMTAAPAAELYWDTNFTTAGSGNSGGNWQGGNWNAIQDGTGVPGPWVNGSTAVFSAGTDGIGAWTVDVGGDVTAAGIRFAQAGTKTVSNGTINIGGGFIDSSAFGFVKGKGDDVVINSILTGSGGLTIAAHGDRISNTGGGGAELRLNGTNTFSGGLKITSGLVSWGKDSALGDPANVITLDGGGLLYTDTTMTSAREIKIGGAGATLRLYGSRNLTLTTPFSNAAGVTRTTILRNDGGTLYLPAGAPNFTGEFYNGAGNTELNSPNANWSGTDFTIVGGLVIANGTGTTVVNSVTSSKDLIIDNGTTVDVDSGNVTMVETNWFKTNNGRLGKLTSSSGTLTITTGALTGDLTTVNHQIQVKITDSGATPVKLVKNNQNQLILTQPNTYSGGTTINGGRLQANDGEAFGTGPVTVVDGAQAYLLVGDDYAMDFTLNGIGIAEGANKLGALRMAGSASISGAVNIASASRITTNGVNDRGVLAGLLTGSAPLEKAGAGILSINGNGSGYTGLLTVSAGRLNIDGTLGGNVSLANTGLIAGEGTIAGDLTLGAGPTNITTLLVDASTPAALSTTNLTVEGNSVVLLTGLPAVSGLPINILNYSGTLNLDGPVGDAFNLEGASNYRGTATFADTGTAITLVVSDRADLVWRGTNASKPTLWDVKITPNWKNGENEADVFFNGDNVLFDDTGVSKTVLMSGMLSPGTVTFNNSAGNNYTIQPNTALFGFTGPTSIVKNGEGTVSIQGYGHNYTGTVTINAGILQADGNNEALGYTSGVTIADGAQFNINGKNLGSGPRHYNFTVAGAGPDGLGVITNSAAASPNANAGLLNLTLTGNASVGGNGGRFDIGRSGDSEGSITGNGFTLTKVGTGTVTMRAPATNITYVVNGGTLKFESTDLAVGTNPIQVNAGTLQSYGMREFPNVINLAAGTMLDSDGPAGGTQFWTGPINLTGNAGDTVKISPRTGAIQLPGVIAGNSNIDIIGNNILYLIGNASNTYNGVTTRFDHGQLILNKTGGAVAIPGDLILAAGTAVAPAVRSVTSTLADNQFAEGSVLQFTGVGESLFELKGTSQTLGGLDYPLNLGGVKAVQHSEFGLTQPIDAISDLTIDVAAGEYYEYVGALRNQFGLLNVVKEGSGTQLLGGTLIDYTGTTMVTEGRLILRSDDTHSSEIAIAAGATWEVNATPVAEVVENRAPGLKITGAGTYEKTGPGVNTMGWSGGASVSMSAGGLIDIREGTIRLDYGALTSWTNNKADLTVAPGAVFDLWDSPQNVIVNALNGGGMIVRNNGNVNANLTVGVANGTGYFDGTIANSKGVTNLVKAGTGTQELSGINTYSGNTTVEGGTLHLTEMGSLQFVLSSSSSSNQINGTGTVLIDGTFDIDTTALATVSGTWTLVDTGSLTATFGSSFSPGFEWTEDTPGNWTYENGETTGTFSEATGVLTFDSGASYASWIDGFFPGETDENIIGANADPDGDGIANAVELMIGGNPATGMDAKLLPTVELVNDPAGVPAGDYLLFTYRRSALATAAGLTAASEYDADLVGSWTTAQDGVDGVVVLVDEDYASFDPAATATDRVRVYIPRGTDPKLFGRLSVTVPGAPAAR